MNYLNRHGTRQTPQNQPIPGRNQVENSAGGFVFATDKWQRLNRFLILGSEGGTYYASERKLTTENVQCVHECIAEDAMRTVRTIVEISEAGRAPKNDPALFALACCISNVVGSHPGARRAAAEALPRVARIGTHLYQFIAYAETMRGWGSTLRWAVSNWYNGKPADKLAYDVIKYRQRDGWSHRDLLRLAHPKGDSEHNAIYDWVTHRASYPDTQVIDEVHGGALIQGFEEAQHASTTPTQAAALVRKYRLPREALKTEHLNDPEVWRAMLETGMPLTAMIRNIATMTRNGVLEEGYVYRQMIQDTLADGQKIRKARVHPMAILTALVNYAAGHGDRSSNTWKPLGSIVDALDAAFYLAFDNVEPTNKPTVLALDVSGSMGMGRIAGSQMTPRLAAAAMALVTVHVEPQVEVMAFTSRPSSLAISKRQRIDDVLRMTSGLSFGATDCALPFLHARPDSNGPHNFAVYTDSETWAGQIQPAQALKAYRETSGINARSAVIAFTSTGFSIADPQDPGMMDFVGFDAAAPAVMSEFFQGRV